MEHVGRHTGTDWVLKLLESTLIVLGSKSPRRREIIEKIGFRYRQAEIPFDESRVKEKDALLLARLKNEAYPHPLAEGEILLTADTLVKIEDKVLGKPGDEEEARRMIRLLSGRMHAVETGVCLRDSRQIRCFKEITRIRFRHLDPAEIDFYVSRYQPLDKAGAYGIQEWIGLTGISAVEGDYYNVMGLPAYRVWEEVKAMRLPFIRSRIS
ncbi:MAG: septum formation protein Maf [Chlorobi bacterium]|nr:septum formation protein Maf [Chlorobiota bacterium]